MSRKRKKAKFYQVKNRIGDADYYTLCDIETNAIIDRKAKPWVGIKLRECRSKNPPRHEANA